MKIDDSEKSTGAYPYGPISICLPIVEGVKALGGVNSPVSKASLASYLKEDEKSTGLTTKIASAKAFGMIDGRSNFRLTESAVKYFSKNASDRNHALLDFLEAPSAFKVLVQTFDGTLLPPVDAIGLILKEKANVPNSWRDRVSGFFLRSAKYAGAVDEGGHLRVKAAREKQVDSPIEPDQSDPVSKISPPRIDKDVHQNGLFGVSSRGFNSSSQTLSLSTVDVKTGQRAIIFAEIPESLTLDDWKILNQWVLSRKPAESSKQEECQENKNQ